MIEKLFVVAVGGAIGAVLRFLTVVWAGRIIGEAAVGTLIVNVVGSAVMGVAAVLLLDRFPDATARVAPFLLTGVLGGFTTFSAFSLDAFRIYESGRVILAASYVGGSVALSIAGLVLGIAFARVAFG